MCRKPFITEIKGYNSGNTIQMWQCCPGPELSADREEISFILGTTKYSAAKITPDISEPKLPWLIIKTRFNLSEYLRETSKCREEISLPKAPSTPWPQGPAKQLQMNDRQGDLGKPVRCLQTGHERKHRKKKKSFFLCLCKKAARLLMNGYNQGQQSQGTCSLGQGERAGWEGERRVRVAAVSEQKELGWEQDKMKKEPSWQG